MTWKLFKVVFHTLGEQHPIAKVNDYSLCIKEQKTDTRRYFNKYMSKILYTIFNFIF